MRRAVADQPRGELRQDLVEQRHPARRARARPRVSVSAAPISTTSSPTSQTRAARAAGRPPTTNGARRPRRLTSTPQSVEPATSTASGCSREQREGLGEGAPAGRSAARSRRAGWRGGGRGSAAPGGERVVGGGRAEGVRGVPDRPVAGAAAQVAARARAGRSRWARARASGPSVRVGGHRGRPVVLGGHAADEARRAVAALRPAAHASSRCTGCRASGRAEALGGDDLLAVERGGRAPGRR